MNLQPQPGSFYCFICLADFDVLASLGFPRIFYRLFFSLLPLLTAHPCLMFLNQNDSKVFQSCSPHCSFDIDSLSSHNFLWIASPFNFTSHSWHFLGRVFISPLYDVFLVLMGMSRVSKKLFLPTPSFKTNNSIFHSSWLNSVALVHHTVHEPRQGIILLIFHQRPRVLWEEASFCSSQTFPGSCSSLRKLHRHREKRLKFSFLSFSVSIVSTETIVTVPLLLSGIHFFRNSLMVICDFGFLRSNWRGILT